MECRWSASLNKISGKFGRDYPIARPAYFSLPASGKCFCSTASLRNRKRHREEICNWRRAAFVCYNNAMKQAHVGSDFDHLLREEGLLEECEAGALRRLLALQIEQEMKRRKISRATLARRMKTPRENLDQLFSEDPSLVTLQFVEKVAAALGRKLRIELA